MKKQLAIATGVMLLATGAHATKTRMTALGQNSTRGSHYMSDSRNVFRNAANINSMNNYVVTEWGTNSTAEGGFARAAGSFNYGVYLGSDINGHDLTAGGGGGTTGYAGGTLTSIAGVQAAQDDIDLFFGGDAGMQWGANLHYGAAKSKAATAGAKEKERSQLGLGVGVIMGDLSASLNYTLKDEATEGTTAGAKFEDDGTMNLSVSYKMGANTFYAEYDKLGVERTSGTGVAKDTTEQTTMRIGAGHVKEVSNTARINMDLTFVKLSAEDKNGTTAANNQELDQTSLPLTIGFEVDANSWLVLRGSVSQNIFIGKSETKTTAGTAEAQLANSTNVNAGATLNFGKLKVDGTLGTSGGTTDTGVATLDNLMTQVAVHYWF